MAFPKDLKYTKDHEWLRIEGDNAYIGITEFAQGELGDIVFVDVDTQGETLAQEEVFGPVLAVMRARNFEHAIDIANNVDFGLSASIQTTNVSRIFEYVQRIEAGLLTVNLPRAGVEYQLPFGGTKDSSFGPKEQGPAALDFYTDYKPVYQKY